MLAEVKSYLMKVPAASAPELSKRFNVDPTLMKTWLDNWCVKGRVKKVKPEKSCGSGCSNCLGCQVIVPDFYQWVN